MSHPRNLPTRFLGAMVAVLFSLCAAAEAPADDITFKIAIFPGTVSSGSIWMKTSEKAWYEVYPIPPVGTLKVSVSCAAGTFFKARINDDYTPFDRNHLQKGCAAGEIAFLFRQKAYVNLTGDAKAGTDLASIKADDYVMAWQSQLTAALANDDSENSLKLSSQIYNYLIENKKYAVAEKYRVLNFDKAKALIDGGELFRDPVTQRYVLTEQDEQAIMKIQALNGLDKTGKLDWPTMKSVARHARPPM